MLIARFFGERRYLVAARRDIAAPRVEAVAPVQDADRGRFGAGGAGGFEGQFRLPPSGGHRRGQS
ncbi:MAG: hypothetical protein AMXMBFR80_02700 [Dehalococcoidia bacterium]